jgi:hypothetical protein
MKELFDEKLLYCGSLGHNIPFKYCRSMNSELPCRKIKDCWFERIDIEKFIEENYSVSEQERIFAEPPDKISTILGLIKKAQGK